MRSRSRNECARCTSPTAGLAGHLRSPAVSDSDLSGGEKSPWPATGHYPGLRPGRHQEVPRALGGDVCGVELDYLPTFWPDSRGDHRLVVVPGRLHPGPYQPDLRRQRATTAQPASPRYQDGSAAASIDHRSPGTVTTIQKANSPMAPPPENDLSPENDPQEPRSCSGGRSRQGGGRCSRGH